MNIIAIMIIAFIVLETTNVVALYFFPIQNWQTASVSSEPGKIQAEPRDS
jgi:hypothetical protein